MFNLKLVIPQNETPYLPHWSIVDFHFVWQLLDFLDGEPRSLKVKTETNSLEVHYIDEHAKPFHLIVTPCKPITDKHLHRYAKALAERIGLT